MVGSKEAITDTEYTVEGNVRKSKEERLGAGQQADHQAIPERSGLQSCWRMRTTRGTTMPELYSQRV